MMVDGWLLGTQLCPPLAYSGQPASERESDSPPSAAGWDTPDSLQGHPPQGLATDLSPPQGTGRPSPLPRSAALPIQWGGVARHPTGQML